MRTEWTKRVYVISKDERVQRFVVKTLGPPGFKVSCFGCVDECPVWSDPDLCDLLIYEVKSANGIVRAMLKKVKEVAPELRVLLIASARKLPVVRKFLDGGADEYVVEPLDSVRFLWVVKSMFRTMDLMTADKTIGLTKTEMRVLELVIQGKSNKEIAWLVERSPRSVECYRLNIWRKLERVEP